MNKDTAGNDPTPTISSRSSCTPSSDVNDRSAHEGDEIECCGGIFDELSIFSKPSSRNRRRSLGKSVERRGRCGGGTQPRGEPERRLRDRIGAGMEPLGIPCLALIVVRD